MARFRPRGLPARRRARGGSVTPTGRMGGTRRYIRGMRDSVVGGRGRPTKVAFGVAVVVVVMALLLAPILAALF